MQTNEYYKEYSKLKGKELTLEELNQVTKKYEEEHMKNVTPNMLYGNFYYGFNQLTEDYLFEQTYEEGEDTILFDVINFYPSDYVLALWLKYNVKTNKITIEDVSIDS